MKITIGSRLTLEHIISGAAENAKGKWRSTVVKGKREVKVEGAKRQKRGSWRSTAAKKQKKL
jgi:hypothetical protein